MKTPTRIDRLVPGVGRLVIRAGKLNRETRNELDLAISRAVESNHLEQLRMLKSREISPSAFLEAARQNRLLALAPSVPLKLRLENLGNGVITFTSQPGSKSRGKTRHVPISQELSDCLTVLGTVQNGRVFPYSRSTIRDWWAELCTELGIKGVTLHGLRATAITRALGSAIAPVQIQKLVGHSNLNTTMRYYRNGVESQEAAQAMRVAVGFSEKVF